MEIDVNVAMPSAKKYDEKAVLEEERKGERTYWLPQSLSLREQRSSWHPKKFVWVDDQILRIFIELSRVEIRRIFVESSYSKKFSNHWQKPDPGDGAVKVKSHAFRKREKKQRGEFRHTMLSGLLSTTPRRKPRSPSSSFRATFTKIGAKKIMSGPKKNLAPSSSSRIRWKWDEKRRNNVDRHMITSHDLRVLSAMIMLLNATPSSRIESGPKNIQP